MHVILWVNEHTKTQLLLDPHRVRYIVQLPSEKKKTAWNGAREKKFRGAFNTTYDVTIPARFRASADLIQQEDEEGSGDTLWSVCRRPQNNLCVLV